MDGYYSLAYGSPRGNVRAFYRAIPAKEKIDTYVAKFRLKYLTEVQINWNILTLNAVVFVIGKPIDFQFFTLQRFTISRFYDDLS